jgi:staphylococcal nuclease domain-containing protein 1
VLTEGIVNSKLDCTPERTLALAEIDAPRLGRRPGGPNAGSTGTPDEPCAWEAREFMRKLLVGKPVLCSVSHTVNSGREYGSVLYGSQVRHQAFTFPWTSS